MRLPGWKLGLGAAAAGEVGTLLAAMLACEASGGAMSRGRGRATHRSTHDAGWAVGVRSIVSVVAATGAFGVLASGPAEAFSFRPVNR